MKVFAQSRNRPSQVLFAFDEVVFPGIEGVRWAVAYSTLPGCQRLTQRISGRLGQLQWHACRKSFLTSFDYGLTDPSALDFLSKMPNSQVYIANPGVKAEQGFRPAEAFHPKLFLFDGPDAVGYVVGSANLTQAALISNTEVVSAGREPPANCVWNDVWSELMRGASPLTDDLLKAYREKWAAPKLRPIDPDLQPAPPIIQPTSKAVFWDAVTRGRINPALFEHFWVEAGSMPSGGSHNQLEIPRGANRFFGFNHTVYGDEHITIGHPAFTIRDRRWTDRPLTWHGNNKMERINLPTQSQGGFEYRDTAVLFRRHSKGFEIHVAPWDDSAAIAWRAASEALGTVFRLGERGQRICGLF